MKCVTIEPRSGFPKFSLKEILQYRELLFFLIWRDVKVRYKQTKIGLVWVIFNPMVAMLIYTLFFGVIIKVPSGGVPYSLFFFTAYVPYVLFSEGVGRSVTSIISNASIMKKVYYPKIIMPLSTVISPLIDFCIMFGFLLCLMIFFGFYPTLRVLLIPVVIVSVLFLSTTVGMIVSALNTQYRDFGYIMSHIMQLWLYASPVVYMSSVIPHPYSIIYNLNPMVFIIDTMRWIVIGSQFPELSKLFSFVVLGIGFLISLTYFKFVETRLVDVV
jgi:lipopolysaccharide transport system permease protein